jgi:hypothetical protein
LSLCGQVGLFKFGVVLRLGFGRRDIADGFEQAAVIEPVDPFQRGVFDIFERAPRALPVDELGLVETVDGFCQGVVITVAGSVRGTSA